MGFVKEGTLGGQIRNGMESIVLVECESRAARRGQAALLSVVNEFHGWRP